MVNGILNLQKKLEQLETLVDTLIEEKKGLLTDLEQIDKESGSESKASGQNDVLVKNLEEARRRLAESEATNQRLLREKNLVRDRLTSVRNRLDQIEGKLLENR
ncbi:MAG: hypothetical protein H6751_01220 [Candidatus Omnitrophica bacterium]|nr:hypothetical protein [Candidatus Omnitrophota bacterium]MCA9436871.1 hypothetical protein [Candidatus Omnitrophota bacterium]MCA9443116.1 hypothetical protein [Candidatus Omnitrophota bacterium]MCB9767054.1 hypothetical protein [Candidatus Omnitrophota bacterium]MCB9781571.1 hypothetical protein [Candidatus Omnitrophota bacterium]